MSTTRITDAELQAATRCAERNLPPVAIGARRYLVSIVPTVAGGRPLARVAHVEYGPGTEAVLLQTWIEFPSAAVVAQAKEANAVAPLALEEMAIAERLVREKLFPVLAVSNAFRERVALSALTVIQARRTDPRFGHRLVRMYFSVNGELASPPSALVDLSTESVALD
jgi:hypothetical protein